LGRSCNETYTCRARDPRCRRNWHSWGGFGNAGGEDGRTGHRERADRFIRSDIGYVTARYICNGGLTENAHLWVSVKQTADRSPDNALKGETSSEISAAWSQSHPTAQVACDGQWHAQTFTISQADYGFGNLRPGQGYVQFCLFGGDSAYTASLRFVEVTY